MSSSTETLTIGTQVYTLFKGINLKLIAYILIAIIEAKDNNHSVRTGIQQGLDYAQILDIPYVFSSNGDGFLYHDCTVDTIKKWWNNRKESKVEEVVYDRKAIIENLEKSFQESLQILDELNNG